MKKKLLLLLSMSVLSLTILSFSIVKSDNCVQETTREVAQNMLLEPNLNLSPESVEYLDKLTYENSYSSYCDGWADGYVAGYCYEVYGCVSPVVPVCPVPRANESGYKDGYNRGFSAGNRAQ
jgi:hypothetical protein